MHEIKDKEQVIKQYNKFKTKTKKFTGSCGCKFDVAVSGGYQYILLYCETHDIAYQLNKEDVEAL